MGLEKQGSKPYGLIGKIVGRLMNRFQTTHYIDYFKNDLPPDYSKILDICCGGGEFLKFLSNVNNSYSLYGLDHSPEMVELSKKVNKKAINQNKIVIIHGSVTEIPLKDSMMDMVTAFETVQFWPETDNAFNEIKRILKNGGTFLIINRYPPEGSKWHKMAKIKNDKEFINKLENSGFNEIKVDLGFKEGWIIAKAIK